MRENTNLKTILKSHTENKLYLGKKKQNKRTPFPKYAQVLIIKTWQYESTGERKLTKL